MLALCAILPRSFLIAADDTFQPHACSQRYSRVNFVSFDVLAHSTENEVWWKMYVSLKARFPCQFPIRCAILPHPLPQHNIFRSKHCIQSYQIEFFSVCYLSECVWFFSIPFHFTLLFGSPIADALNLAYIHAIDVWMCMPNHKICNEFISQILTEHFWNRFTMLSILVCLCLYV